MNTVTVPSPRRVRLRIEERGGGSRIVEFCQERITIGRRKERDVYFPKGNVSKLHCELYFGDDGELRVRDRHSTNGTMLNDRRIDNELFRPGDELFVGDFVLSLVDVR